jgi:hypothetical protein
MVVRGGRELWMQTRGPQEIQSDFRLWKEPVPQVHWEGGVNCGEPGHKVFLESPDGEFLMCGEETIQIGQCLVVESLELRFETFDRELLMDGVICFDPL